MQVKFPKMKLRTLFFLLLLAITASAEPWPQLPAKIDYESYLSISPDGSYVALDSGNQIQVWDGKKLAVVHRLRDVVRPYAVTFSPDNRHLIVSDYPVKFAYYDCADGLRKVWEYHGKWNGRGDVQDPGSYGVIFSPDGKYVLAVGSAHGTQYCDSVVRIFETAGGRVVFSQGGWGGRSLGGTENFAFSPDSKMLVRSAFDKIQIYSLPSGKKLHEKRLGGEMFSMAPTEKGVIVRHSMDAGSRTVEQLFSWSDLALLDTRDDGVEFENQPDGPLHWRLDGGRLQVAKGDYSVYTGTEQERLVYWVPGGGFVVSSHDDGYSVYDIEGRKLAQMERNLQFHKALAWDGVGYGGQVALYDLITGKQLAGFAFSSGLELSENGKVLAVACPKGVYLMDVPASCKAGTAVGLQAKVKK